MTDAPATLAWTGNQVPQADFLRDMRSGWLAYVGGYGSGKSWAGARKLLFLHLWNQCPSAVYAPTYGDLWRVCAPELQRACEEAGCPFDMKPAGSGLRPYPHMMVGGQPIILQSADEPGRIAGYEVGAAWIDEAARIPTSRDNPTRDAPTQIRARLRHPKARALVGFATTTPEGTETWLYRDFEEKPLPAHRYYRGRTADNPALPSDYASAIRSAFGAELAKQYLDGEAVDYRRDIAHPTFGDANISESADWPKDEAGAPRSVVVHIGADFNVSPLCWVAGWLRGDVLCIAEELVVDDFALVDDAMRKADALGWGKRGAVRVHPDRSGGNRNRTGDPECVAMDKMGKTLGWVCTVETHGANPPVNQRINTVSRQVCDGNGARRLLVHPRCRRLRDEMRRTGRGGSGYDAGSDGKRGHILDALGYLIFDVSGPLGSAGVAALRL